VALKKEGARSRCVFHIGGGSSEKANASSHEIKRSYMKRFIILGLTVVLTAVGITAGALAFAVPKTSAATDLSARGPSVGVDFNDNQFVFWRGQNQELEEAVYNASTGTFNGNNLSNLSSNMGSEPTVAVANFGGFLSGGTRFGAQFVFWKGTSNGLWYTFWDGSWHTPIQVPGATNVTATPSAAFNSIRNEWGPGNSEVTVFWESSTDGTLWFVRLTDPLGGHDNGDGTHIAGSPQFTSPHEATFAGETLGTLGSAPGASNSSVATIGQAGNTANGQGQVTWNGFTTSSLWYVPYSISLQTGDLTITNIAKNAASHGWNNVNGGPSATQEYALSTLDNIYMYDLTWQDNNHDIEYASASADPTTGDLNEFQSPNALGASPAASAPTIGYWFGNDPLFDAHIYIFYKGQDGFLHEEYFNSSAWHAYYYPQFGILG
jgi:hypothetical protein